MWHSSILGLLCVNIGLSNAGLHPVLLDQDLGLFNAYDQKLKCQ